MSVHKISPEAIPQCINVGVELLYCSNTAITDGRVSVCYGQAGIKKTTGKVEGQHPVEFKFQLK